MMSAESVAADDSPIAGVPVSCWITVFKAGAVEMDTYRAELFAHEVFHCYQAQMAGEIARIADRFTNGTTWWVEGGASWAACNAVPGAVAEPALGLWRETPRWQLMDRAYDAVGFFTLLTGYGIDLWTRWPQIVKTESTYAAFNAAAGPEYELIRRVWAFELHSGRHPRRGVGSRQVLAVHPEACAIPAQEPVRRGRHLGLPDRPGVRRPHLHAPF